MSHYHHRCEKKRICVFIFHKNAFNILVHDAFTEPIDERAMWSYSALRRGFTFTVG